MSTAGRAVGTKAEPVAQPRAQWINHCKMAFIGSLRAQVCCAHAISPARGGEASELQSQQDRAPRFPDQAALQGYLPLDYWRRLILDDATEGPRGGRLVTFENVGRKLSESEFIPLVAGAWVGSGMNQSSLLEQIVREVVESGKAVALAVRSARAPSA